MNLKLFYYRTSTVLLQREGDRKKLSLLLCCSKDFVLLLSLTIPALLISIFLFSPSFRSMAANNAEYQCSCIHSFTDHFSEHHTQALSFSKYKSRLVTLITHGFLQCAGETGFHYPAYVKRSSWIYIFFQWLLNVQYWHRWILVRNNSVCLNKEFQGLTLLLSQEMNNNPTDCFGRNIIKENPVTFSPSLLFLGVSKQNLDMLS